MLQGAGITVVMTRVTDVDVNRPAVDRNGDGRVDHPDELIARNDVANTRAGRPGAQHPQQRDGLSLRAGHRGLRQSEAAVVRREPPPGQGRAGPHRPPSAGVPVGGWKVHDRGIGPGDYFSLRPATNQARRPSLMPAILGESLYLDDRPRARPAARPQGAHRHRRGLLRRCHDVAGKPPVRHPLLGHPGARQVVPAGGDATVHLRIQNTGNVRLLALASRGPGRAPRAGPRRFGHSWSPRRRRWPCPTASPPAHAPTSTWRSRCPASVVSGC